MKPPVFKKTVRNHDVLLSLIHMGLPELDVSFCDFMEDEAEGIYQDISKPLTEKQLLNVLAQAYAFGYERAVAEASHMVTRMLYERPTEHKPKPKIAKTENIRW